MIGKRYFSVSLLLVSINKKTKIMFFGILFLLIIETIFSSLSIGSLYPMLEIILNGELQKSSNFIISKIRDFNLSSENIIKISLYIIIISSLISIIRRYVQVSLGESLRTLMHENLSSKVMSSELNKIFLQNEGILVENLARNTDQCAMFLLKFLDLLFMIFYIIFLFITLMLINIEVSLLFLIFLALSYPLAKKYLNLGTYVGQEKVKLEKKLTNIFVWMVNNLKEIYVLNLKNLFFKKVSQQSSKLQRIRVKNKMYSFIINPIFEILFTLTMLIIFIYFSDMNKIRDSLPFLITFFLLGYKILTQILNFFSKSFRLETILAAISSIKKDIGLEFDNKKRNVLFNLKKKELFEKYIYFNKVKLRSLDGKLISKNYINLKIKKNSTTLIIGKSGAGKTTILDILLRVNENFDGDILFDKIPVKKLRVESLKNNIGYVTQNCSLFSDNLLENIILNTPLENAKLNRIAELCEISSLISRANDSVNSKKLSGGELRRICLARALYKEPEILLIDEALGSTDEKFESKFIKKIKALNITIVLVSHRKSSIKNVDYTYRLK